MSPRPEGRWGRGDWALCLLLAGGAALLRLRADKPAELDELFQLFIVSRDRLGAALEAMRQLGPLQAPLDYLAGFAAARVSDDLPALRLLPACWGVAAVALAFSLGRALGGRGLGALWALLLAVSLEHISVSLTFRQYSLGILLSLVFLSALLRWERSGKPMDGAFLSAASALLLLALPDGLFLTAAAVACAYAGWLRVDPPRVLWLLLPGWIGLALWMRLGAGATPFQGFHAEHPVPPGELLQTVLAFGQGVPWFAALHAVLFAAGLAGCSRSGEAGRLFRLAAAAWVSAVAGLLLSRLWFQYAFLVRHAAFLLPLYAGVIAAVLAWAAKRASATAAIALVYILLSWRPLAAYRAQSSGLERFWRESAGFLRANAGPKDALVAANPNTGATLLYYLDRSAFLRLTGFRFEKGYDLFAWPQELAVLTQKGQVPVYTLCGRFPGSETLDAKGLQDLARRVHKRGGTLWAAHAFSINYFQEPDRFPALLPGRRGVPRGIPGVSGY